MNKLNIPRDACAGFPQNTATHTSVDQALALATQTPAIMTMTPAIAGQAAAVETWAPAVATQDLAMGAQSPAVPTSDQASETRAPAKNVVTQKGCSKDLAQVRTLMIEARARPANVAPKASSPAKHPKNKHQQ